MWRAPNNANNAPNNASKWQMGFNLAFKALNKLFALIMPFIY
jgi:hypothetical protein